MSNSMKAERYAKSPATPASGRLAIAFQEPLAAIVRVKSARDQDFRTWVEAKLKKSEEYALRDGYSEHDTNEAKFALVASLDEAARYSSNSALDGWTSLQGELYNSEDAGETFFTHLKEIQSRGNTSETADLLEVYALCLLLGFEGKYKLSRRAFETTRHQSLPPLISDLTAHIRRLREGVPVQQPWRVRGGPATATTGDPWIRRLAVAVAFLALALVGLYAVYGVWLRAGLRDSIAGLRGTL